MIMEASDFVASQQKILIKRSGFVNLQRPVHLRSRGITAPVRGSFEDQGQS